MTGKKGGDASKMKKFPRIADYLQAKHKAVWEIFNDAGMLSLLNPRKGSGVTLLLPDSKTVDKYRKVLEGDKPEAVTDWLSSLVLTSCIKNVKEFEHAQNVLGLALPMEKGAIKDISKLEHDTAFVPFDRSGKAERANMAVWKITGEYPWNEGKPKQGGRLRGRNLKKGGNEPVINPASVAEITKFVNDVFKAESECLNDAVGQKLSRCMIDVKNLLSEWRKTSPELYHRAVCILTVNPVINFCLLYLNAHVFSCAELKPVPYLYSTHNGKMEYLQLLDKRNLPEDCGIKQLQSDNDYKNCYETIDKTNSCGSVSNVYPADLAKIFSEHPGLHRYIDEFKFIMAHYMRDINEPTTLPDVRRQTWQTVCSIVCECCGLKRVKCMPATSEICKAFESSRYYMHLPYSKEDVDTLDRIYGADEDEEEEPSNIDEAAPSEEHAACAFDEETKKCLLELLEEGDAEKLKKKLEELLK